VAHYGYPSEVCVAGSSLTRRFALHMSIFTIFEGTSEIQRLIIARAISGVHIR
jgi:alkylation response protein AidB-like acyl-CoA dehydrogenase